jgi:hypothetical protein
MDVLGINFGLLLEQTFFIMLLIGLPIISLIDFARKGLSGTLLAIWALVICAIPLIGSFAYWIIKPTAETKA